MPAASRQRQRELQPASEADLAIGGQILGLELGHRLLIERQLRRGDEAELVAFTEVGATAHASGGPLRRVSWIGDAVDTPLAPQLLRVFGDAAKRMFAVAGDPGVHFLTLCDENPPEMFSDDIDHLTPEGIAGVAASIVREIVTLKQSR